MELAERMDDDWDVVAALAADLHDAHARLVVHMTKVIQDDTWAGAGIRSPEHFLTLRAGLSRGQARAIVLLAKRSAELPETARALHEGRISLDQAAVVARHTPAEFDETVAEFAQYATVTQLQRSVARYDFTLDESDPLEPTPADEPDASEGDGPDEPAPPEQQPPSLSMWHGDDGRFHLSYEAPGEIGALVETALAEAKDWLIREGAAAVSHADALAVIANRSLDGVTVASRRAKYRVNVFLDTDGGWLLGRPRLPQHVVDGLTCDGQLVPVWETAGVPVSVGAGRRTVPERTRRLILDRDRGCRFPGCDATRWLEIHHIRHWRHGGPTDYGNLAALCTFHHDEHHRNAFTIVGDPIQHDGLTFLTRGGWPIRPGVRDRHAISAQDESPRPELVVVPPIADGDKVPDHARPGPAESPPTGSGPTGTNRPRRRYRGPNGDVLHLSLVDFTPPRRAGSAEPEAAEPEAAEPPIT
jgi:hypothetical protein